MKAKLYACCVCQTQDEQSGKWTGELQTARCDGCGKLRHVCELERICGETLCPECPPIDSE